MQGTLLPLFPLHLVLFPGTPLPLHIFEERYKEMIGEVLEQRGEFGVVLAAERGIMGTGCSASIERVLKTDADGKMDLVVLGRRRFEIVLLNQEREYLRGEVSFFEDEEAVPAPRELQLRAMEGFAAAQAVSDVHVFGSPELDDPQLSFQLAQLVPDLQLRQLLLASRSEEDRIKRLIEFFPHFVERQKRLARLKEVAPRNGHSHTPSGRA